MISEHTLYIQKEQMPGTKNNHATRKSPRHIAWVRALDLILCKQNPPNLYKIESAFESDKGCLNGGSRKWCIFRQFIQFM
jgi:hypothetical protein